MAGVADKRHRRERRGGNRGYYDEIVDFLNEEPIYGIHAQPLFGRDQIAFDIITNPPYKYATEFVLRALELLPARCKCYMFLKLTFLESEKRYKQIFKDNPPIRIHVFSNRVACAKNGDFSRVKESGGSVTAYSRFLYIEKKLALR